jgi:two-component system sensor histidine kinase YcbA
MLEVRSVPSIKGTIRLNSWQRSLIIGISVCLSSQLYFSGGADGFRLSAAAILYPILLMSLKRESHRPDAGIVTAVSKGVCRIIATSVNGREDYCELTVN